MVTDLLSAYMYTCVRNSENCGAQFVGITWCPEHKKAKFEQDAPPLAAANADDRSSGVSRWRQSPPNTTRAEQLITH